MLNLSQHPRFGIWFLALARECAIITFTSWPTNNMVLFDIGITNDLVRRVWEHKQGITKGFTAKYKIHMLVYYEQTMNVSAAIAREKQLKNWHRDWKFHLIENTNPDRCDLYAAICGTVDAETSSA